MIDIQGPTYDFFSEPEARKECQKETSKRKHTTDESEKQQKAQKKRHEGK